MNEELLLTFLAAAHEGSFTKAAKLRSYSVPSVMSQINELENYLGVSLFFRTNRGITLTKAGKRFLPEAEDLIHRFNQTIRKIQIEERVTDPLHIRIGFSHLLPLSLLNPTFFGFIHSNPNITYELVPLDDPIIVNDWINPFDRVDLIGYPLDSETLYHHYVTYSLYYANICISMPYTHELCELDSISIQDLNSYTLYCQNTYHSGGISGLIQKIQEEAPEATTLPSDDFFQYKNINRCISENTAFLSLDIYSQSLPFLKHVPLTGVSAVPYGIILSDHLSKKIQKTTVDQ